MQTLPSLMATYSNNEERGTPNHPYLLAPRGSAVIETGDAEDSESQGMDFSAIHRDRMAPAASGIIAGLFAGAAALGVVHALLPQVVVGAIGRVAEMRGLDHAVTLGIGYATAAALGALVGATFAVVTRYLRKWPALFLWALVFFVSLTMLILAVPPLYGRVASSLASALLVASAAYAFVVSFSLPIRRRR